MAATKFLVTGCAGFIGGHMLERLAAENIPTVGVDNLSTGKRENMAGAGKAFEFIEGDLCDPAVAARAVRGATHVVHLASIPSVPRSVANPLECHHASVTSTVTLLEAARNAGVRRVVQAASSAAYGDNETLPQTEDLPPRPLSPYAAAKLAQEQYGRAFAASMGLDTVAFRYFNVFGPRQDPTSEYSAVIPKFITLMLAGKQPTIFGDGGQSRDFIYVANIVEANLRAALHPDPLRGEILNLACGGGTDLNTLVAKLNAILGTRLEAVHAAPRAGEVRHSVAAIGKVKRILGYVPAIGFDEGLRRTAESFRRA